MEEPGPPAIRLPEVAESSMSVSADRGCPETTNMVVEDRAFGGCHRRTKDAAVMTTSMEK